MPLSWTLDKGPFARSAADFGLVLQAIAGKDGKDPGSAGRISITRRMCGGICVSDTTGGFCGAGGRCGASRIFAGARRLRVRRSATRATRRGSPVAMTR